MPLLIGFAAILLLMLLALGAFIGLTRLRDLRRGYSITFHGRAGLTYEDARGVVEVDGEMLGGPMSYVIDASSMRLAKAKAANELDIHWRRDIVRRVEQEVGAGKLVIEGAEPLDVQS